MYDGASQRVSGGVSDGASERVGQWQSRTSEQDIPPATPVVITRIACWKEEKNPGKQGRQGGKGSERCRMTRRACVRVCGVNHTRSCFLTYLLVPVRVAQVW